MTMSFTFAFGKNLNNCESGGERNRTLPLPSAVILNPSCSFISSESCPALGPNSVSKRTCCSDCGRT
jgi:hypothetical protein